MNKKKLLVGIVAAGLAVSLAGCAGGGRGGDSGSGDSGGDNSGALIGVAMPTKVSERWIKDGDAVKSALEDKGYKVDLEYADNKIPQQVQQVSNMITKGAKVLIVASIDGGSLSDQLDSAAKAGIDVISYDRLLTGNENVDYYVSFDNYKVGVDQGTSLLTGLGLADADGKKVDGAAPKTIEVFAGSPDDNNATFFFNGAMDTLKPYIEDGSLTIGSGQDQFTQAATQQWDPATAKARMQNLIASTYSGGTKLDGVLSPYDGISIGIISALEGAGYASDALPVVTGQDADKANVKAILADEQSMTVWKDTRTLGDRVFQMVQSIVAGEEPEVNDTETYDNGEKVVPSYLLEPQVVVKDDVQSTLVDSGFLTAGDVGL